MNYWSRGLPEEEELLETRTVDGGTWMQSFSYDDLAHLIIPPQFYWERSTETTGFQNGYKHQNIEHLSAELTRLRIGHRLTDLVLEVRLY